MLRLAVENIKTSLAGHAGVYYYFFFFDAFAFSL